MPEQLYGDGLKPGKEPKTQVPSDFVPLRERHGIHHQTCPQSCWCADEDGFDRGPSRAPRKIDQAFTEMQAHLDWLRNHRSPEGDPHYRLDLHREVGVMECLDMLARYRAKEVHHA